MVDLQEISRDRAELLCNIVSWYFQCVPLDSAKTRDLVAIAIVMTLVGWGVLRGEAIASVGLGGYRRVR
jgi:hypothetical protein